MDSKELANLVANDNYNFLRTNEHLGDRIAFLTLGGSHAYGTNIEGSDVDIRGCTLNRPEELLGLNKFEQFIDTATDTTVYGFSKLAKLFANCNPNCIEMLGCKPEHYIQVSEEGKMLLDNRHIFLSKRAICSFGGYANQQLNRISNAIARDSMPQSETENHILRSCKSAMMAFNERYADFPDGAISLYLDDSESEELEKEIFADITLKHYPVRDYKNIWSDFNNIIKDYGKLNKRNNKKDRAHLAKHSMHLVRLYLMCCDILEKEEIITYREADHDLLMSIRNGCYLTEGNQLTPEFNDLLKSLEERMEYAKLNTALPEAPDTGKINELVMEINSRAAMRGR